MNGLVLQDLRKVYENFTVALKGLSYTYPYDNGVIGIIGPNGAGKTTLLSILATVIKPTSGRAVIKDYDILRDAVYLKKKLSYLPQDIRPFLYSLTGYDYAIEYLRMRGEDLDTSKYRVKELFKELNIVHVVDKPIGKVSGGEAKKIFLSVALAVDADVYIFDEPTAELDPASRVKFWSLLRTLSREGKLIIVASHYTEELSIHCDDILIINEGVMVTSGPPKKIIETAFTVEEKIIVRRVRNIDVKKIIEVIKEYDVDKAILVGDTIFIYPNKYELYDILNILTKLGEANLVWKIEVSRISLEDYVISLLGDNIVNP